MMTKTPAPSINVRGSRNDSLSNQNRQSLATISQIFHRYVRYTFCKSARCKNYGGSASDSSLSAGELRRYNVKDNNKNWAATSAPGVKVGDDGGSMMVVGLVAVMLVIAVVAFLLRG